MSILECVVSNVAIALMLALIAALVGRITTKPQVAHALWVLVLVKLVTPPVVRIPVDLPVFESAATVVSADAVDAASRSSPIAPDETAGPTEDLDTQPGISGSPPVSDAATAIGGSHDAPTQSGPLESGTNVLVGVWLAGSAGWFLLACTRLLRFRKVLRYARPASRELCAEIRSIASRYGSPSLPRVVIVDANVPPLIGSFGGRTTMVLPHGLLRTLGDEGRVWMLAHELAHLRRRDHWIRWFEFVVLGIYWWNPVAWWARTQVQRAEEVCCDGWVLSVFPGAACRYAQTLLDTVEYLAVAARDSRPAMATAFGQGGSLRRRIQMIVSDGISYRLSWRIRVALALFASVTVPLSLLGSPGARSAEHAAAQDSKSSDVASQPTEDTSASLSTELAAMPQPHGGVTRVCGNVVDRDGQPIAGAQVWHAYAVDGLTGKRLGIRATSDAAGQFTLEIPPLPDEGESFISALPGYVWGYSPDHCLSRAALHSAPAQQPSGDLRVELFPATDTSLIVLDPAGRPVPEALVEPWMYGTQGAESSVDDGPKQLVSGRTDADGRVLLPALARDRLPSVSVATEKYGVQIQRFSVDPGEPAERTIRLRPVGRIEGRVIADRPEWVHDLRCTLTTAKVWKRGEPQDPAHPTEGYAEVTTDHQGRFAVPALAEGYFSHRGVQYDGRWPVRPVWSTRPVLLVAGGTVSFEIPMSPPGRESKEAWDAPPLTIDQLDRLGQLEEHSTVVIQVPVRIPNRQSPDVKYVFELPRHNGLVLEAEAARRLDSLGFDDPELRRRLDGRTVRATGTIRRYRTEIDGRFAGYYYNVIVSDADAFAVLPIREADGASEAKEKPQGR